MDIAVILLLLLISAVLMLIELFIIPGTSISGIASLCCLAAANIMTFVQYGAGIGLAVLAASLVVFCLLMYWMMHSRLWKKYSLHKSIDSTSATEAQLSVRPGDEGIALTRLALIGNADINGKTVEVKSVDGFLDEGTHIVVTHVQDAQISVKEK